MYNNLKNKLRVCAIIFRMSQITAIMVLLITIQCKSPQLDIIHNMLPNNHNTLHLESNLISLSSHNILRQGSSLLSLSLIMGILSHNQQITLIQFHRLAILLRLQGIL